MQQKLTLRLDDAMIAKAKDYAFDQGRSLSDLVSTYFNLLTEAKPKHKSTSKLATVASYPKSRFLGALPELASLSDDQLARLRQQQLHAKHL